MVSYAGILRLSVRLLAEPANGEIIWNNCEQNCEQNVFETKFIRNPKFLIHRHTKRRRRREESFNYDQQHSLNSIQIHLPMRTQQTTQVSTRNIAQTRSPKHRT